MKRPPVRVVDLTDEHVATEIEARRKWPPERIMGLIGFIGGVFAVVFSLGVDYNNLRSQERRLDEHIAKDVIEKMEFQRRDVSSESTRRLEEKIDGMSRELRVVSDQLRRLQSVPPPTTGRR